MREGWERKPIKEVVIDLHQGLNTAGHKIKFYETGYPIIQTRNLENGVIDIDEKMKFMSKEDWLLYRDKYKPNVGDVFLTNIGTIGKTAVVDEDLDYLIHWNIFIFKLNKKLLDPYYLKAFLDSPFCHNYYLRCQKGGTVNFITKKMIEVLEIPLPPLPEQQRIVQKLNALSAETNRLESIYQQKLTDLEELKKSILQKAFNGELNTADICV
jgi:type I restriction enzyme S subunit